MHEIESSSKLEALVKKLQPAGVKEMLLPRIKKLKSMRRMQDSERWYEYTRFPDLILKELVDAGLVIMPDLKLPPEFRRFREEKGGIFPNEEYAHLEGPYRDAWMRLTETIVNARAHQIVWVTEENNIWPNYNGMKLSKDHHLVNTPRHDSLDDVVTLSANATAEILRALRVGDIRVGFDRQGVDYDKKALEVGHLSDIFRGKLMDLVLPLRLGNDFIGEVEFYADNNNIWTQGVQAIVKNVPSLSRPGQVHYVTLHGIPIVDPTRLTGNVVDATQRSLIMSYNFSSEDTCEKPTLWTVKYGRKNVYVFDMARRKTRESWEDMHTVFSYFRTMRVAEWQRAGQVDPGRNFVVLPMFPEPTLGDTKSAFRRMYGLPTSSGTEGGVVIEDRREVGEGAMRGFEIYHHPLSSRLVDLDIALHNLVAFVQDPMTPRRPRVEYNRATAA